MFTKRKTKYYIKNFKRKTNYRIYKTLTGIKWPHINSLSQGTCYWHHHDHYLIEK